MEAFVKSFATYRTIAKATVISSALTLDSLEIALVFLTSNPDTRFEDYSVLRPISMAH